MIVEANTPMIRGAFVFFMAEIKYGWNNLEMPDREAEIANSISQMFLFGCKVKKIKSKLKEINSLQTEKTFYQIGNFAPKKLKKWKNV